jgi:hypothetical protein
VCTRFLRPLLTQLNVYIETRRKRAYRAACVYPLHRDPPQRCIVVIVEVKDLDFLIPDWYT